MSIDGTWRDMVGLRLGFGYLWRFHGMNMSCGNKDLSSFVEMDILYLIPCIRVQVDKILEPRYRASNTNAKRMGQIVKTMHNPCQPPRFQRGQKNKSNFVFRD